MSNAAVRIALESRLGTWAAARIPALPVAWENVPFDPALGASYLRAFLLPADTLSADLEGLHRGYSGLLQVSVAVPINVGPGAAVGIADELAALFPVNGRYTSGSVTTQITGPASVGPAQQEPHHYVIPVSIRYRADTI